MIYKRDNFGDLELDDLNGALDKSGSSDRLDSPFAAPEPVAQATDDEVPGAKEYSDRQIDNMYDRLEDPDKKEKSGGGMGNILGLVGSFMGGAYGAALQGAGSLMGNKK